MKPEIDELYAQLLRPLPPKDRLELLAAIARDLALDRELPGQGERSLLELEGLGSELWRGVDAQQYVHELRNEWDRPL
ncbi:MAG: hypothetical protein QOF51_193 [Chloroflexota bacterium]|jgi:hypothetical protein|nr:hypothetical protein [Chloroflexota bacterium]